MRPCFQLPLAAACCKLCLLLYVSELNPEGQHMAGSRGLASPRKVAGFLERDCLKRDCLQSELSKRLRKKLQGSFWPCLKSHLGHLLYSVSVVSPDSRGGHVTCPLDAGVIRSHCRRPSEMRHTMGGIVGHSCPDTGSRTNPLLPALPRERGHTSTL